METDLPWKESVGMVNGPDSQAYARGAEGSGVCRVGEWKRWGIAAHAAELFASAEASRWLSKGLQQWVGGQPQDSIQL